MNAPEQRAVATVMSDQAIDLFTAGGFALAQRIANALSTSTAVPDQFRAITTKRERSPDGEFRDVYVENPAAMGNCLVAIEVARAVGMSIVAVMQNADNINGKLRWSSKFQIAAINASGRFTPLQFDIEPKGEVDAVYREKGAWNKQARKFDYTEKTVKVENVVCRAWAFAKDGGKVTSRKVIGPAVSMKMAVEEGWFSKDGSKWQGEMAELMLQYRAGTFFGSLHAPDVIMGMGQPSDFDPRGEVIDITPEPEPAPRQEPPRATSAEPPRKSEPTLPADVIEAAAAGTATAGEAIPAGEPAESSSAQPQATNQQQPKVRGEATPAASVGELATLAEKQHLRLRVDRAGADMGMTLEAAGVHGVNAATLDGLTKTQFEAAKKALPAQ